MDEEPLEQTRRLRITRRLGTNSRSRNHEVFGLIGPGAVSDVTNGPASGATPGVAVALAGKLGRSERVTPGIPDHPLPVLAGDADFVAGNLIRATSKILQLSRNNRLARTDLCP